MNKWVDCFSENTAVFALPNWDSPRLLVGANSIRERWQKSAFYPAFRLSAKVYKTWLRFGLLFHRNAIVIDQQLANPVRIFLDESGYAHYSVAAILLGDKGPMQKIVFQLQDAAGQICAYLKYAEQIVAMARVNNEYRTLSTLPSGIAPQQLHYGKMGNGIGLLTKAITGRLLPGHLTISAAMTTYLAALPRVDQGKNTHPWLSSCQELGAPGHWLDVLAARAWGIQPFHGDFAPWNILRGQTGQLYPIDWEYSGLAGFPGFDLAYYLLQTASLLHHWPPQKTRNHAVQTLVGQTWLGMDHKEAESLVRLTAFYMYHQSQKDGKMPTDSLQHWRRGVWK